MVKLVSRFARYGRRRPRYFRPDPVARQQDNGLLHFYPQLKSSTPQAGSELASCKLVQPAVCRPQDFDYAAEVAPLATALLEPVPRRITSCAIATRSRCRTCFAWSASAVTRR